MAGRVIVPWGRVCVVKGPRGRRGSHGFLGWVGGTRGWVLLWAPQIIGDWGIGGYAMTPTFFVIFGRYTRHTFVTSRRGRLFHPYRHDVGGVSMDGLQQDNGRQRGGDIGFQTLTFVRDRNVNGLGLNNVYVKVRYLFVIGRGVSCVTYLVGTNRRTRVTIRGAGTIFATFGPQGVVIIFSLRGLVALTRNMTTGNSFTFTFYKQVRLFLRGSVCILQARLARTEQARRLGVTRKVGTMDLQRTTYGGVHSFAKNNMEQLLIRRGRVQFKQVVVHCKRFTTRGPIYVNGCPTLRYLTGGLVGLRGKSGATFSRVKRRVSHTREQRLIFVTRRGGP